MRKYLVLIGITAGLLCYGPIIPNLSAGLRTNTGGALIHQDMVGAISGAYLTTLDGAGMIAVTGPPTGIDLESPDGNRIRGGDVWVFWPDEPSPTPTPSPTPVPPSSAVKDWELYQ